MFSCRRVQGLIAESLYEDLQESDRALLERHLDACEACREEAQALGWLVQRIPANPVLLDRDLLPGVRRRLAEERTPASRRPYAYAAVGTAAVLALVVSLFTVLQRDVTAPSLEIAKSQTLVEARLAEIQPLIENREFPAAYLALSELLEEHPGDPTAGDAQRLQADIAFTELKWYPEALTLYRGLRDNYGTAYRVDTTAWERLELLDEAQGPNGDFAALHALDVARRSNSFEGLEAVVARFPTTHYVASLAADEMARVALESTDVPVERKTRLYAMQTALERCDNPMAIARLKVELGNIFLDDLGDTEKARRLYEEVVQSGPTVLAQLAAESLLSLPELPGR